MSTIEKKISLIRSKFSVALLRPDLGAIVGVVLVFLFFFLVARDTGMFSLEGSMNWGIVSSQFIIIAVGACLLMIAGEFDLSVGSMIGFAGIVIAVTSVVWGWPVWLSILIAFVVSMSIGALIGYITVKTNLPSFIVSLAFLYILRGMTIFIAIISTKKTIIGGVTEVAENDWLAPVFGGKIFTGVFDWLAEQGIIQTFVAGTKAGQPVVSGIPMMMVWAIGLVIFAHFLLTKTRFGNWIYASGGDAQAARHIGVPVNRVKILMFVFTAFCATVFATTQVIEFGSASADRGILKEFEAIISVVIGGALLTGGYGSVIGAALGAVIFGVVQQGLFFIGVESSLFRVFLGVLLLLAVILNTHVRKLITGAK
ncbi:ABC transporter permease [Candidatus Thioglobus sp.]|uniref:ABC transporter permease n=1 Tax=Candidatus Pseudothioglobus sp. Uisw_016 TaxID=3230995 RepID=UPI00233B951F|nr:ABC transporter permease [Candidatus Thioglobus sp.]MDB4038760.1 ABC transporter permease [Candidatus Thioglobus sp.]MDB9788378.1 ABC transporter permease [Candidatus Thioglobus sp.]MDC1535630.1 ABC transporter permease [Candidatus Thioglobus sp.]